MISGHSVRRLRFGSILAVPIAILISNAPVTVPIAVPMFNAPAFALSDDERREQERKEEARKEEQRKEEARREHQREEQRKEEARKDEQRKEGARREQAKREQAAQDATRVENAKEEEKRKEEERKVSMGKPDGTYSEVVGSRTVTKYSSRCGYLATFTEKEIKYTTYSRGERVSSSMRTEESFDKCEEEPVHEPRE